MLAYFVYWYNNVFIEASFYAATLMFYSSCRHLILCRFIVFKHGLFDAVGVREYRN